VAFPPGDRGVPLSELCCPTCGGKFLHEPYQAKPEWNPIENPWALEVVMDEPPSLVCQHDHRWAVKNLYQEDDKEMEVLLDRYLGTV
jgi:hypothetical protein